MDEATFPYRLDQRTRDILAGMMSVLIKADATIQAASGTPMTVLFNNKDQGVPMDAQVYTTPDGIALVYRLNNVALAHKPTLEWLKKYNAHISGRLKSPASPAAERCTVMVEATYNGQIKYYFTYMMRYEDDSLAQDMPQGRLVATEPLMLAAGMQARPAGRASEQEVSWI